MFYPHRDPRSFIPAITTTVEPFRTATTPAGAPTMYAGPLSVTPVVPGNRTLVTTFPRQVPDVLMGGAENIARIVMRLPGDALLEFDGTLIPGSGRIRKYSTPPLVRTQLYHYDIQASWMEEGREVVQQRHVELYAGDRIDIDFLAPPPRAPEHKLHTDSLPLPAPTVQPLRPTVGPRGG
jgi:uncharacterized protein (TIGR03000 family)